MESKIEERNLTFAEAIEEANDNGKSITRLGWSGKHFVRVLLEVKPFTQAVLAMYTQDGQIVPWLPSQTDMLSEDWRIFYDNN